MPTYGTTGIPVETWGGAISESLELRRGKKVVYAWDVWMVYDHDAMMGATGMPVPALFMHQLPKLRDQADKPFLDADVFANKATSLLGALPAANPERAAQ